MPTYDYKCEACEHTLEIYQNFSEDTLKICPNCKQERLVRLFGNPFCYTKGEAKTLGHLADINTHKLGKTYCQEQEGKKLDILNAARKKKGLPPKDEVATPWWRNGSVDGLIKSDKPLTTEQVDKYKTELQEMGCSVQVNAPQEKKRTQNEQE